MIVRDLGTKNKDPYPTPHRMTIKHDKYGLPIGVSMYYKDFKTGIEYVRHKDIENYKKYSLMQKATMDVVDMKPTVVKPISVYYDKPKVIKAKNLKVTSVKPLGAVPVVDSEHQGVHPVVTDTPMTGSLEFEMPADTMQNFITALLKNEIATEEETW